MHKLSETYFPFVRFGHSDGGAGLSDEWVVESSYKFQLSRNFSLTPDVQILFNPANNPGKSNIWVGGVRFVLTL